MEIARTSSDPTRKRRALRAACLVACLIGWSASGAATPSALQDGERSRLPGLELATGDYTVEIADLMGSGEESPDAQVPYLFLTPRVANILENVFGDTRFDAVDVADAESSDDGKDEAPTTGPVAENVEAERPLSPEAPSLDNSAILPRFQRQMYRTDI